MGQQQSQDINPVDSLAELIVESIPGHQNDFPEPEHQDDKSHSCIKYDITFKMARMHNYAQIVCHPQYVEESDANEFSLYRNNYQYMFWEEVNHPPA
jgi:hypothetical protein